VLLRLWRPAPPRWALGAILLGYVAAVLWVILAWFAAPQAVFAGFILLTWVHWGWADLWWSWQRERAYFTSRWHRVVFAAWRGALPMLIPLAVDPELYRQTAEGVCNLFLHRPADFQWLERDAVRLTALGVTLGLGATDFILARRGACTRWLNLAEGLGLLAFFGTLPALVSVGFYFAFWHGLRHVRRLLVSQRMTWGQFAWRAAPATVGALAMLGALALCVRPLADRGRAVGVYLALIAALTVPHAVTVTLQDVRDGLWRSD
jgi:Brp/Blh family beta-carotene 15,15'-monooxygenase